MESGQGTGWTADGPREVEMVWWGEGRMETFLVGEGSGSGKGQELPWFLLWRQGQG